MRADGHQVSTSTVQRALRRRGLLLPTGFRADRKSWALLRKKVFHAPPTARNRVWQTDFSEFETTAGGIWWICAVIDYATKYCLAVTIGPTSRAQDAVACLHATIAEAERVTGLDDLRDDRGLMDIVDPDEYVLGQVPAPIAVVTDNGPWFRGEDPLLGTSAPGPLTPDQRRRRTVLRLPEARTPLPCRHRRRRRPRRRGPPLFAPLQHDPAAPGAGRVHQKVFERNPGGAVGSGLRCS